MSRVWALVMALLGVVSVAAIVAAPAAGSAVPAAAAPSGTASAAGPATPVATISSISPTSGVPGISVHVLGQQIQGATSATVNGAPAYVAADSPTELILDVPDGATSGAITVTTPAGTVTSAQTFTVDPVTVLPGEAAAALQDPAIGRIFVSCPTVGTISVLDDSGNLVTTITDEPGVTSMAVVGSTLYALLAASGEVVSIDTTSFTQTGVVATGLSVPRSLVYADGLLWTSVSGGMDGIDLTTHAVTVVSDNSLAGLLADPANPDIVVSPTTGAYVDLSTTTPTPHNIGLSTGNAPYSDDAVMEPDGSGFLVENQEYTFPGMVATGAPYGGNDLAAVGVTSADGGLVAIGNYSGQIDVFRASSRVQLSTAVFGDDGQVVPGTVSFGPTGHTLYAVTRAGDGTSPDSFRVVPVSVPSSTPTPVVSSVTARSGSIVGGAVVTVYGHGLSGATQVDFGSTPGTNVVQYSDLEVQVTAPVHVAGTVDVTVTTAGGTSQTVAGDRYTFQPPSLTGPGWQAANLTNPPAGLACPDTATCYVDGNGYMLATKDGGSTWSLETLPNPGHPYGRMACGDDLHCWAVDEVSGTLIDTSDGGSHWSADPLPVDTPAVFSVTCAGPADCWVIAGSELLSTTDGGTTWVSEPMPSGFSATSISCPDLTHCWVSGYNGTVLATADDGAHWSVEHVPGAGTVDGLFNLTCVGTSQCWGVGNTTSFTDAIFATSDGGVTWQMQYNDYGSLTGGISCPSSSRCLVMGTNQSNPASPLVLDTLDGGNTWDEPVLPLWTSSPTHTFGFGGAIACPSVTVCVAISTYGLFVTTDGGLSVPPAEAAPAVTRGDSDGSATVALPPVTVDGGSPITGYRLTPYAKGVALPSIDVLAASAEVTVSVLTDGTSYRFTLAAENAQGVGPASPRSGPVVPAPVVGWQSGPLLDDQPSAMACPSAQECVALAGGILRTTDGGADWSDTPLPVSLDSWAAIDCVTTADCWAAGGDGVTGTGAVMASSDGGKTWTTEALPAGIGPLYGITCADTTHCWVEGDTADPTQEYLASTADGGATWVTGTPPPAPDDPSSVVCTTDTHCLWAAGDMAFTSDDGGSTWSPNTVTGVVFQSLSCAGSMTCFATAKRTLPSWPTEVLQTADGGVSWQGVGDPPPSDPPSNIGCASASVCSGSLGVYPPNAPPQYFDVRTTDGGATWHTEALPTLTIQPYEIDPAICHGSACVQLAVSSSGSVILTSADGGVTPPGAPAGVQASVSSKGIATVTWQPPMVDGGTAITHYVVTARPVGPSKQVGATQTKAVFAGLTPGSTYTFRVVAVSSAGTGAPATSNPVRI